MDRACRTARGPSFWLTVVLTILAVLSPFAPDGSLSLDARAFSPWHALLEFSSVVISMMVFGIGWNSYARERPLGLTVLSCGFLFVGLTGFMHALSYPGMPDFISPNGFGKSIFLWLAGRGAEILTLLALTFLPWRPFRRPATRHAILTGVLTLFGLVAWTSLVPIESLTRWFAAGEGPTAFAMHARYSIVATSVLAALLLHRQSTGHPEFALLGYAAWMIGVGELFFTCHSELTDFEDVVGHFYKLIAELFVFRAVFAGSIREPYERLQDSERRLEESRARLSLTQYAVDSSSDLVLLLDQTGRIRFANNAASDILGYGQDRLLAMSIRDIDAAMTEEQWRDDLEGLDRRERTYRETRYRKGSGEWLPVEVVFSHFSIDGCDYVGSFARDLSERTRHQKELLKLSMAIEQSPVSIVITDASGNIEYANPQCLRATGYTRDEVIGKNPRIFNSGETPAETYRQLWQTISAGRVWTGQLHNRRKNGEKFWERVTISPVVDGGIVTNFVAVKDDVTDIKRAREREAELKEQLMQASKMEAIGHLTGGIAHDFNNILTAILGYAELLKLIIPQDHPASRKMGHHAGEIITASRRARDLIAQLLAFSRQRPAGPDATAMAVLLQPIVKEVFNLLRSSLPTTINLKYRIDDPGLRANIQPVHLHQILMNLCINGRDAIGNSHGDIECVVTKHRSDATCSSCHHKIAGEEVIEIAVSDDGAGIPESALPNIFDPFFTTKEIGKGSGMGLSVVHGVAHTAGGHLVVRSHVGVGTTVSVLLPASDKGAAQAAAQAGTKEAAPAPLSGVNLMVVDDEQAVGAMLQELLEMQGARVRCFNSSIQAFEYFLEHADGVDLVITDETMPNLSGTVMATEMLKIRPDLPVILCTGHSDRVDPESVAVAGIRTFMPKPLDLAGLTEAIHRLIPGRSGTAR